MTAKRRVVMKDVAARAGVHQTTVSLALRGHPSISKATRERVQQIAAEMGYQPDPALSALVAYRGNTRAQPKAETLGFILNFRDTDRYRESHVHALLLEGAQLRAEALGYRLEPFWFGRDYPRSEALDRVLKTRQIRGLILGAFHHEGATDLALDWNGYSVAKINLTPTNLRFETVLTNQMYAVRLAMRRMSEEGYRRVGLVVAEHDEIHNRNLYTGGYFMGQHHYAPEDRIPPLVFPSMPYPQLVATVRAWALEHALEVVLANWNNFEPVTEAVARIRNAPCRLVPLDCNAQTRKLGGIDQNHAQVGERAVDLLVGQLQTFRRGVPEHASMTLVDPSWVNVTATNARSRPPTLARGSGSS